MNIAKYIHPDLGTPTHAAGHFNDATNFGAGVIVVTAWPMWKQV